MSRCRAPRRDGSRPISAPSTRRASSPPELTASTRTVAAAMAPDDDAYRLLKMPVPSFRGAANGANPGVSGFRARRFAASPNDRGELLDSLGEILRSTLLGGPQDLCRIEPE